MESTRMWFTLILALSLYALPIASALTETPMLYVADQERDRIIVIDPQADRVVTEIKLEHGPAELAFAPHAAVLYASHPDVGEISVLGMNAEASQTRYAVDGSPFGIVALSEGSFIYADWIAGNLTRIDQQTGESSGKVNVGHSPAAIIADHSEKQLYVAVRADNSISVVDTKSFTTVAQIPVGQSPFVLILSPDEKRLYVANVRGNSISVIDTKTFKVTDTISAGVSPYGLAVTSDGGQLLVTNQQTDTLTVVDTKQFAQVSRIKVGRLPEGVAIIAQLNKAYVMNWFSGDISVIDLATDQEMMRIKTGGSPRVAVIGNPAP